MILILNHDSDFKINIMPISALTATLSRLFWIFESSSENGPLFSSFPTKIPSNKTNPIPHELMIQNTVFLA